MGKHSPKGHRRNVHPFVRAGAILSVLVTALTLLFVLPSAPVEVAPAVATTTFRAPESRSAVTPALTPTPTPSVRPTATTAPATGTPRRLVIRISAIHIERPRQPPVTITETVTVAPAAEEEAVVAEAGPETPMNAGEVCVAPPGNYDGVRTYVGIVGAHIQEEFDVEEVQGKADRGNASEHPKGLALDFMTDTGNVDGDDIRDYLLERADDFGVMYVIWEQTLYIPGQNPEEMGDRGGATANHFDHVHVSFESEPGPIIPTC